MLNAAKVGFAENRASALATLKVIVREAPLSPPQDGRKRLQRRRTIESRCDALARRKFASAKEKCARAAVEVAVSVGAAGVDRDEVAGVRVDRDGRRIAETVVGLGLDAEDQ